MYPQSVFGAKIITFFSADNDIFTAVKNRSILHRRVMVMMSKCRRDFINLSTEIHSTYEPHHEKTGFFHMRKQRRRSASR